MRKELLFKNTGNPAFISVTGLSMEFVDTQDSLVVYSEETKLCYGSYPVLSPNSYNFVVAYGNDEYEQGRTGFNQNETIKLAYYDAQMDSFFDLDYNITDWQGNPSELKFIKFGMYKVEVLGVGDLLTLNTDPELSEVFVKVEGEKEVDHDDYFFSAGGKNIQGLIVVTSGTGQLKKGKWWVDNKWANYKYIPAPNEQSVTITALATNIFTEALISDAFLVKFSSEQPQGEGVTVGENEYYKIVKKPFRSFGDYVFITNKDQRKLGLRLYFNKDGKVTSNVQVLDKGETGRALKAQYDSVQVKWIKLGVSDYINVNETYNL